MFDNPHTVLVEVLGQANDKKAYQRLLEWLEEGKPIETTGFISNQHVF
jgi:hypothetical protein